MIIHNIYRVYFGFNEFIFDKFYYVQINVETSVGDYVEKYRRMNGSMELKYLIELCKKSIRRWIRAEKACCVIVSYPRDHSRLERKRELDESSRRQQR